MLIYIPIIVNLNLYIMSKFVHDRCDDIIKKKQWLFHIIPLKRLRNTNKVEFDIMSLYEEFNWIDIVTHKKWAKSPGTVWDKHELWYMHRWQEDNLITLSGNRYIELYDMENKKIERFEISHEMIKHNWEIIHKGPAILWWPNNVFHRNYSPEGSVSMNFAVRTDKFDLDTEFNIYDLDINNWNFKVARIWKLDQFN